MQDKLKIIPEILLTVTDKVYHYEAMHVSDKYIVWAEDSEGSSLEADNYKTEQSIQGTIDYFTKEEFDENVDKIQDALISNCISFYLNSVQYESLDDSGSGYIHYEFVWEVS